MDGSSFDALVKRLHAGGSRRGMLAGIAAALAGAAMPAAALGKSSLRDDQADDAPEPGAPEAGKRRHKGCRPPCGPGYACVRVGKRHHGKHKRKHACECLSGIVCGEACCDAGDACIGGQCQAPAICVEPGDPCQADGLPCCDSHSCAAGQSGSGTVCCLADGGQDCASDADCCAGRTCVGGRCGVHAVCDASTCPSGCCTDAGACAPGTADVACGAGGGHCRSCRGATPHCANHVCSAVSSCTVAGGGTASQNAQALQAAIDAAAPGAVVTIGAGVYNPAAVGQPGVGFGIVVRASLTLRPCGNGAVSLVASGPNAASSGGIRAEGSGVAVVVEGLRLSGAGAGTGVGAAQGGTATLTGCRIDGWSEGVSGDGSAPIQLVGDTTVTGNRTGLGKNVACAGFGNAVCGNTSTNCKNAVTTGCGCKPAADPCGACNPATCPQPAAPCQVAACVNDACTTTAAPDGTACPGGTCAGGSCVVTPACDVVAAGTPDQNAAALQAAIDAAADGAVIAIGAGAYNPAAIERNGVRGFQVFGSLTLAACGNGQVDLLASGPNAADAKGILVGAGAVRLRNLAISGADGEFGVGVLGGGSAVLDGCAVAGWETGVEVVAGTAQLAGGTLVIQNQTGLGPDVTCAGAGNRVCDNTKANCKNADKSDCGCKGGSKACDEPACDPAACPAPTQQCQAAVCIDDVCGFAAAPDGTACTGGTCQGGTCVPTAICSVNATGTPAENGLALAAAVAASGGFGRVTVGTGIYEINGLAARDWITIAACGNGPVTLKAANPQANGVVTGNRQAQIRLEGLNLVGPGNVAAYAVELNSYIEVVNCTISGGWAYGVGVSPLASHGWIKGGTTVTGCTVNGLGTEVSCAGTNRVCGNPGGNCVNAVQSSCGCAPDADPC